jgi:hypothetical protein
VAAAKIKFRATLGSPKVIAPKVDDGKELKGGALELTMAIARPDPPDPPGKPYPMDTYDAERIAEIEIESEAAFEEPPATDGMAKREHDALVKGALTAHWQHINTLKRTVNDWAKAEVKYEKLVAAYETEIAGQSGTLMAYAQAGGAAVVLTGIECDITITPRAPGMIPAIVEQMLLPYTPAADPA